jgi:phosphomannomutase
MKSVSGIRGVFPSAINSENIMRFAAHFGCFQKRRNIKTYDANSQKNIKIVVGKDSRTTGEALSHAVISGLLSVGVDVVWLGIVSTPTLLLNVLELKAQGGICITASHNPAEWNAMKFVDANGMFLFPGVMNEFLSILDQNIEYVSWKEMGRKTEDYEASNRHIQKILSIGYLNVNKIKEKKYKVVLDSVNGAGGVISPKLLAELDCEIVGINTEPTGYFAHNPEPLPKNLTQICEEVKRHKADIGFATDPDVDRLVIINERGECIGEEYSLLLASKFVLSHKKGDIITNLSSSMANDDIAREFGVRCMRTKIGEINVGKLMQEIRSPIGGEGNGGIICPDVNYTRDAITGMALILGLLAHSGKKISEIASMIPKYYIAKDKIETDIDRADKLLIAVEKQNWYANATIDTTDGVKIILSDAWIHIRKSGTEPIIRVYVEAKKQTMADDMCKNIVKKINSL